MDVQTAWAAGLVEGEGCIDTRLLNSGRRALRIRVKMTDRDVVERLASIWNSAIRDVPPANPRCQPQYEVQLTGHRAEQTAEQLRPLLGERRLARLDVELERVRGG